MATYEMTLAGKKYVLASPIQREPIPELAQQMRQGAAEYADRQGSQFWVWEDLSGGLGLDIIDCNKPEDRCRTSWESEVDTRFPGSVILGPLTNDGGNFLPAPTSPQYGRFLDIPGALMFASSNASWKCQAWQNSAASWKRVSSMATNATNAEKGRDWAFPVPDGTDQRIYLGTGGALFSSPIDGLNFAACGTNFPARGLGFDFGEELMICQKTKDDGNLYIVSGHPTTPVAVKVAHMGGLIGDIVSFYDSNGEFVPYISVFKSPSGDLAGKPLSSLYVLDPVEEKLYPVADAPPAIKAPASAETWQNICVWQGWIYMFLGHDLFRYRPGQWESVPLSKTNFTMWDMDNPVITGMARSANWLYLVSTYSSESGYIFAVSPAGEWHSIALSQGSSPAVISDNWSPSRLYFLKDTSGWSNYLKLPSGPDNPLETATYAYTTHGYLRLPWFDGQFADIVGTALRMTIIGDKLSATEKVTVRYRTVRDATWTTLGVINDSTSYLDFASGVGLPFKIIQLELEPERDPAVETKTPIIRRIVFQYIKKAPLRYRYTANILVKATKTGLRQVETILTDLQTAYEATTLQALAYGRTAANVNITSVRYLERPPSGPFKTGQRNVYQMEVVMEEPI